MVNLENIDSGEPSDEEDLIPKQKGQALQTYGPEHPAVHDSMHEYSEDAEFEGIDFTDYKGFNFYEDVDEHEKNHDPETGAHFKYNHACKILNQIKAQKDREACSTRDRTSAATTKRSKDRGVISSLKRKLKKRDPVHQRSLAAQIRGHRINQTYDQRDKNHSAAEKPKK